MRSLLIYIGFNLKTAESSIKLIPLSTAIMRAAKIITDN